MVTNLRQLVCKVGHVVCDHDFTVARASRFFTEPGGVVVATGAFAPGQVLNFGSTAYVTDYNGKHHPLEETVPVRNESPTSYPPLGLLGADIEVLA
jgi:hypothetical protein